MLFYADRVEGSWRDIRRLFLLAFFSFIVLNSGIANAAREVSSNVLILDCEFVPNASGRLERHLMVFDLENRQALHMDPLSKESYLGTPGKKGDEVIVVNMKLEDPIPFYFNSSTGFSSLNYASRKLSGQCISVKFLKDDKVEPVPILIESETDCLRYDAIFMQKTCQSQLRLPGNYVNSCKRSGFQVGFMSMDECIKMKAGPVSAGLGKGKAVVSPSSRAQPAFSHRNIELTLKNGFLGERLTGDADLLGNAFLTNRASGERLRGEISPSGHVNLRGDKGTQLRGTLEKDSFGTLQDQKGNRYQVKPN